MQRRKDMANKLVDYMKNVHSLEQNIYALTCAQEKIQKYTEHKIQNLISKNYETNRRKENKLYDLQYRISLKKAPEVKKKSVVLQKVSYWDDGCFAHTLKAVAFWLLLIVIGLVCASLLCQAWGIDFESDGFIVAYVFGTLFSAAIAFIPFGLIFALFGFIREKIRANSDFNDAWERAERQYKSELSEQKKLNQQYEQEYEQKVEKCQAEIAECDSLIAKNNYTISELQASAAKNIADIEDQKSEIRKVLKDIYSVGIIYPKYRALIPISMFIEYFESGRCQTLKGHEGAYNIYESEVRQDTIISSLANISSKMNVLQERQYMLYSAIKKANRISSDMVRYALDSANSSRRTAENAERTAQNAALAAQHTKAIADSTQKIAQIEADRLDELKRLIED